jgi:hypothetical protein
MPTLADLDPDRLGQPSGLVEASLDIAPIARSDFRKGDDRRCAAGDVRCFAVEDAQLPRSAAGSSACSARFTG